MILFKTRKTDVNQWCYVVLIFCCVFLANLAGRAGRAVRGLLQKQSTSCCTLNSNGFWLIDGLFKSRKKACQAWGPKFLSYVVIVWWWLCRTARIYEFWLCITFLYYSKISFFITIASSVFFSKSIICPSNNDWNTSSNNDCDSIKLTNA